MVQHKSTIKHQKDKEITAIEILREIFSVLETKRKKKSVPDKKITKFSEDYNSTIPSPPKTYERNVRDLQESAWYEAIKDFLTNRPSEEQEMLSLLESAREILSRDGDKWNKNQKAIFKILEDINEIGFERGMFRSFFEDINRVKQAMANFDFSKQISTTSKRGMEIAGNNFLNYIINSFNLVNQELNVKHKILKRTHLHHNFTDAILNLNNRPRLIISIDKEDVIRFKSTSAELFHFSGVGERTRIYAKEYIINFEALKEKIEIEGILNRYSVKLKIMTHDTENLCDAKANSRMVFDEEGSYIGLVIEVIPNIDLVGHI